MTAEVPMKIHLRTRARPGPGVAPGILGPSGLAAPRTRPWARAWAHACKVSGICVQVYVYVCIGICICIFMCIVFICLPVLGPGPKIHDLLTKFWRNFINSDEISTEIWRNFDKIWRIPWISTYPYIHISVYIHRFPTNSYKQLRIKWRLRSPWKQGWGFR